MSVPDIPKLSYQPHSHSPPPFLCKLTSESSWLGHCHPSGQGPVAGAWEPGGLHRLVRETGMKAIILSTVRFLTVYYSLSKGYHGNHIAISRC